MASHKQLPKLLPKKLHKHLASRPAKFLLMTQLPHNNLSKLELTNLLHKHLPKLLLKLLDNLLIAQLQVNKLLRPVS